MQRFFGVAQDTSGNAIPSTTITVNLAGTATLATIYSDNLYTPQVNPFTSATDGTYAYYALNGRYDVVLTKTSFTFTASETTDVLLDDDFSVLSPAQITSTQNNYAPTNGTNVAVWRINSDATRSITGIAAPTANAGQRLLTLVNTGSFNINLINASASSTAGNKFTCANGRDYALFPNEQVPLVYDTSSAVWRVPWQGSRIVARTTTSVVINNSAAATLVFSTTIAGGLLNTNNAVRVAIVGSYANTSGGNETAQHTLSYAGNAGTTGAVQLTNGAGTRAITYNIYGCALGATNAQRFIGQATSALVAAGDESLQGLRTTAGDSTADQTLSLTITLSAASANLTYTFLYGQVEWLP